MVTHLMNLFLDIFYKKMSFPDDPELSDFWAVMNYFSLCGKTLETQQKH